MDRWEKKGVPPFLTLCFDFPPFFGQSGVDGRLDKAVTEAEAAAVAATMRA